MKECYKCHQDLTDICECEYHDYGDEQICNYCFDKEYFVCEVCGEELEKEYKSSYTENTCRSCCGYSQAEAYENYMADTRYKDDKIDNFKE